MHPCSSPLYESLPIQRQEFSATRKPCRFRPSRGQDHSWAMPPANDSPSQAKHVIGQEPSLQQMTIPDRSNTFRIKEFKLAYLTRYPVEWVLYRGCNSSACGMSMLRMQAWQMPGCSEDLCQAAHLKLWGMKFSQDVEGEMKAAIEGSSM